MEWQIRLFVFVLIASISFAIQFPRAVFADCLLSDMDMPKKTEAKLPIAPIPATQPEPSSALQIAESILREPKADLERFAVIEKNPELAVDVLTILVTSVKSASGEQTDKLVDTMWRIALLIGQQNNAGQVLRVLDVVLPQSADAIADWQIVVMGSGIIEGISKQTDWPKRRIDEILKEDKLLLKNWKKCLQKAGRKASDASNSTRIRYDALRIVAFDRWDNVEPLLREFTAKRANKELQTAAVKALAIIEDIESAKLLISEIKSLKPRDQKLAIDALVKTSERIELLLTKIGKDDSISKLIKGSQIKDLFKNANFKQKAKAKKLLSLDPKSRA